MADGSIKDIKTRIKSIQGTRQITKAMCLVASSKLRRAKERMAQTDPYYRLYNDVLDNLSHSTDAADCVFFTGRDTSNICYCVVAGDRGLAGGYNSNVFKEALSHCKDRECKISVLPIGKKTAEYFGKKFDFFGGCQFISSDVKISDCFALGNLICEKFNMGELDEFFLTYTSYKNTLHQEPVTIRLLPLETKMDSEKVQIECEQGFHYTVAQILPSYIASALITAVSHSYVSELTARQYAMDIATSNADEMISELQLRYNRARQSGITQEITEIVAGANS